MSLTIESTPASSPMLRILKQRHGVDFAGYHPAHVQRRIKYRMDQVGIDDDSTYLSRLSASDDEADQLFNALLIPYSGFFRDPPVWQRLASAILPSIIARRADGEPLRIWSAGCAGGQEAYSLAIILLELLGPAQFAARVRIYATDLDAAALQQAGTGHYSAWAARQIPPALLARYFSWDGRRYQICELLRRAVSATRHNLIDDAPIDAIDLLLCRNTLLYFTAPTRRHVLDRLTATLRADGALVLGATELHLHDQRAAP